MKLSQEAKYNNMYVDKIQGNFTKDQSLKHSTDISKRSITPDTHKSRILVKDEKDLKIFSKIKQKVIEKQEFFIKQEEIMLDKFDHQFYVDEYQYKGSKTSHVLHFGINTYRDELEEELVEYNNKQKEKFELKSLSKGSEDKRIEAIKSFQLKAEKVLTEYEKYVVQKAVEHLSTNQMQKTVLIDFFVRDVDNKIQFTDKGIAITHTVVLYSQLDKYLLIDPSNTTFSYILAGAHPSIVLCINEQMQIYKPLSSDKTGAHPYQWRDCVDIAVKLAFSLNSNNDTIEINSIKHQQNSVEVIDFASLQNTHSIKDITNQKSLYASLPSDTKEYPIRSKQSSDIKESATTTLLLKSISNKFLQIEEKLTNIDPHRLIAKYTELREKTFADNSKETHKEFIKQLYECNDYFKCELTNILSNQDYAESKELALIGSIDNN